MPIAQEMLLILFQKSETRYADATLAFRTARHMRLLCPKYRSISGAKCTVNFLTFFFIIMIFELIVAISFSPHSFNPFSVIQRRSGRVDKASRFVLPNEQVCQGNDMCKALRAHFRLSALDL